MKLFKVVIAGSRNLTVHEDRIWEDICVLVSNRFEHDAAVEMICCGQIGIISGGAKGIDSCGEKCAEMYGLGLKKMPADWNTYGKAAGSIRNEAMARLADAAIVYVKKPTPGSSNMATWMLLLKKPVEVIGVEEDVSR